MRCWKCGTEARGEAEYCHKCGAGLRGGGITLESRTKRYAFSWALIATVLALLGVTGGPAGAIPSQTAGITIFLAIMASCVVGVLMRDMLEILKVFPFVQLAPFFLGILVSLTMPVYLVPCYTLSIEQLCLVEMPPRIVVVGFNIFYLVVLGTFSLIGAFAGTILGEHWSNRRRVPTLRPLDPVRIRPQNDDRHFTNFPCIFTPSRSRAYTFRVK